jgi:NADH-quinone oxidoreductase subunit C
MLQFEQLLSIVNAHTRRENTVDLNSSPKIVVIDKAHFVSLCAHLHSSNETYFDMLSCITALDNGPQVGTMELVYNLYSIPYNHHLSLKIILQRESPTADSVSHIWKTADWHEREAYDMFGIHFKGHPDLRRILMPADWVGYPLRKDYKHEEYYRSIKIEY